MLGTHTQIFLGEQGTIHKYPSGSIYKMFSMHYKQNSASKNYLMNTHNSKLIIFYHFTVINMHDFFIFSYQINRFRTI